MAAGRDCSGCDGEKCGGSGWMEAGGGVGQSEDESENRATQLDEHHSGSTMGERRCRDRNIICRHASPLHRSAERKQAAVSASPPAAARPPVICPLLPLLGRDCTVRLRLR